MTIEELFRKIKNMQDSGEWTEGDGDNESGWGDGASKSTRPRIRVPKLLIAVVVLIFVLLLLSSGLIDFYTDLLWYSSLGFSSVLWRRIAPQFGLVAFTGIVTFLVYGLNWRKAVRIGTQEYRAATGNPGAALVSPGQVTIFAGIFALLAALGSQARWPLVMQFLHRMPFGEVDPIFGHDVGFYVFKLPLLDALQSWLQGLVTVSLIGCVILYLLCRSLRSEGNRIILIRRARLHLFSLAAVLLALFGLGLWLSRYELLYSSSGIVYGMGYTDFHVRLPALTVLSIATVAASLLLLANFFKPMWKISGILLGVLFVAGLFAHSILPSLVQNYIVKPNEYEREKTFLAHHISSTRKAFDLEDVRIFQMTPQPEITEGEVREDANTVENIRLWDYEPLLRTYKQLQEIRTYYDFSDVDIDRYSIGGKNRQVMLSVRELDLGQLQNPTWVNTHLEFTHGYGVVMNPVNEMNEGGLPVFFMQDLPPKSTVPIKIDRPQIYYGEKPTSYALVKTDVKEFDYPMGDANARSTYEGKGGVAIHSILQRLLFAFKYRDTEILFTGSLKPESRILYNRNIRAAIHKVAPFLVLEEDIYPVIIDGRILWLQDAYTASARYPYSRPLAARNRALADIASYDGVNYIRNSVKITVDAYDGTMRFYVTDTKDPLIRSWAAVFPGLFEPAEKAPQGLRGHFRYPEDFFEVQSEIYRIYHMTDTNTYYNREDVWMTTPSGQERRIRPNYVTMQLMDEPEPEFTLIAPFMPVGRNNLIGWMAARCDPRHYGELIVYQFPKQELVFGPSQVDALIDQNPVISSQLSLWSQRGSDVIRGDLLVIPIGKSLLYVQPLYLKAERGDLPELKRVILSTGGRVAWGETFDKALKELLGSSDTPAAARPKPQPSAQTPSKPATSPDVDSDEAKVLIRRAREHYENAEAASRTGDWAKYGAELKELEKTLNALDGAINQ